MKNETEVPKLSITLSMCKYILIRIAVFILLVAIIIVYGEYIEKSAVIETGHGKGGFTVFIYMIFFIPVYILFLILEIVWRKRKQ